MRIINIQTSHHFSAAAAALHFVATRALSPMILIQWAPNSFVGVCIVSCGRLRFSILLFARALFHEFSFLSFYTFTRRKSHMMITNDICFIYLFFSHIKDSLAYLFILLLRTTTVRDWRAIYSLSWARTFIHLLYVCLPCGGGSYGGATTSSIAQQNVRNRL